MAKVRRRAHRLALAFALAAAVSAHARADTEFTDGTFNNSDWTSSKIVDSTSGSSGAFSVDRVASGGNPGPFRRVTHTFRIDYMEEGALVIAHLRAGALYDPGTQGAISSISYSYDLRKPRPSDSHFTRYSPLLLQNGVYYKTTDENAAAQVWTRVAGEDLRAARFTRFAGSGPLRPDFSANGAPIQFGYVTSNSSGGGFGEGGSEDSLQTDLDNWSITLAAAAPPQGVSCSFSPKNGFLAFHRPEWHVVLDANLNPDHVLVVDVVADGAPARDVNVSLTATKAVFSSSPSQPPSSTATARTDSDGEATVLMNPPAPAAFDQTVFEASGSVGERSFSCSGSVVVGLGTLSALINSSLGQALGIRAASGQAVALDRITAPVRRFADALGAFWNAREASQQFLTGGRAPERTSQPPNVEEFEPKPSPELERTIAHLKRSLGLALERAAKDVAPPVRRALDHNTVAEARAAIEQKYGDLPLQFEPNRGQLDGEIRYVARSRGYQVGLTPREILLIDGSAAARSADSTPRIRFPGANSSPRIAGLEELPGKSHYLVGPDPARWRTDVEQYEIGRAHV